jgi:hypothetical protein
MGFYARVEFTLVPWKLCSDRRNRGEVLLHGI